MVRDNQPLTKIIIFPGPSHKNGNFCKGLVNAKAVRALIYTSPSQSNMMNDIVARTPISTPMPVDLYRNSVQSTLSFAPPTTTTATMMRATKRAHDPDSDRDDDHDHDQDDDGDADAPRRGWKRLTTKEEITLFEICNSHADSFGRRSDLCNWWKTISEEFSNANGRPYSWHSVRRRVETVTKRRIKFLEGQQQLQRGFSGANPRSDVMNPQWCAVLDLWIPTWQGWEEAEARRIAKRDSVIRKRPRKSKPGDMWTPQSGRGVVSEPVDLTSPASHDDTGVDGNGPYEEGPVVLVTRSPSSSAVPATAAAPVSTPSNPAATRGVRLPPGFDTMFSNNHSHTPPNRWQPRFPSAFKAPAEPATDNRVVSAVLETLGKLNKHLDATSASGNGAASDARSSPVISALLQSPPGSGAQNQVLPEEPQQTPSYNHPPPDLERIKEELWQEMREELRREMDEALRRDRAALEEKLDSVQRTQDMILEMLRQEPT